MFDLINTLAIVTGAAEGIGFAIANGFKQNGAIVLAVDVKKTNFDYNITGDVSENSTYQKIKKILGKVTFQNLILVNNAGVTFPSPSPYPKEKWDLTIKINLTSPYLMIENIIPFFQKINKGSIINITSLGAERAFPNNPSYIASKSGLKMLTKFYAKSLGRYGVRANNVGPGYMVTEMTKKAYSDLQTKQGREKHTFLGRWGKPEDLVGVCVFLATDASSYITGQDIYVDGGWTSNGLVECENV